MGNVTSTNPKTVSLLGSASIGRTNILRIFIRLLEEGKIGGTLRKTDFFGETTLAPGGRETKTIHPNKVTFSDENHQSFTLLAPGGETDRPVVKIGAITSSRLAKSIVAVFDLTKDLKPQLDYFTKLKIYVKHLWVCLSKYDLVSPGDQEGRIKSYSQEIREFFSQRGVQVKNIAWAGEAANPDYEEQNIAVAQLILEAAHDA